MERRGWPWKKKITEKLASAALEFKHSNEQLDSRLDLKDKSGAMTPLQQEEARVKILSEQLAAKDEIVQQHARVAEEAVTGWEKAESEAASMRQQLDGEIQKRQAAEDRVSHLDGALKECMRQLRQVREQQEQHLHEIVVKKTREWDMVREEMEAKVARMANGILETEAEKTAMAKSLQERAMLIKAAKEGRTRAEEEVKLLQVRLEMSEREQAKWKYELHVLSKELEIRNEELEFSKKAAENGNKQHLENVKKVAKLETECQRLRLLVRKKLPGPAAVAQMRMEVEALGILSPSPAERGRRMSPRRNQTRSDRSVPPWMIAGSDAGGDDDHLRVIGEENRALKEIGEENRALKEVLSKRNNELQAARLLCARTASKLSSVEQQLEISSTPRSLAKSTRSVLDGFVGARHSELTEPSVASVSEDGAPEDEINCAESWATALISELAQFGKKEKGSSVSETTMGSVSCDLMDDFVEMEKLASLPAEGGPSKTIAESALETIGHDQHSGAALARSNHKHEEEVSDIKPEKLPGEGALSSAKKRLSSILEAADVACLSVVLEEVRAALNEVTEASSLDSVKDLDRSFDEGVETAEVRDTRVWSPSGHSSCHSEESSSRQDVILATSKLSSVGSELAATMNKVVGLVEALAQADYDVHACEGDSARDSGDLLRKDDIHKPLRSSEFDSCVQSLIALCNDVLQDKVDILDFVAEMVCALDWIVGHTFSLPMIQAHRIHRRLDWEKGLGPRLSNGCTEASSFANGVSRNHLETHIKKLHSLEDQLTRLELEKEASDAKLKAAMEDLELARSQLLESNRNAAEEQGNLASALQSKQSLMADVASLASAKSSLEVQVRNAHDEVKKLEERIVSLEVQLQDEVQCRRDIEAMFQELQDKHSRCAKECSQGIPKDGEAKEFIGEEAAKARKEQEIASAAERLAECQQTILALGKQLKGLGVPNENVGGPHEALQLTPRATEIPSPIASPGPVERGRLRTEAGYGGVPRPPASRHGGASSYGQMPSPDAYRASGGMESPDYQESPMSARAHTTKDLPLTSPARSPGRFLSLKSRSSSEPKPEPLPSEKHSSGFSRFFSRNRATAR